MYSSFSPVEYPHFLPWRPAADVQLFNFTSFSSYRSLQPILAACSRTSNFSTSPAFPGRHQQGYFLCLWTSFSPVRYPHYLHWRPAAGPPTIQLHQLLQLERSSTPPGSLQQDIQLFNFTSFSRRTPAGPLPLPLDQLLSSRISSLPSLAACSRTSNSLTSPASPATPVFNPSCQPTAGRPTL